MTQDESEFFKLARRGLSPSPAQLHDLRVRLSQALTLLEAPTRAEVDTLRDAASPTPLALHPGGDAAGAPSTRLFASSLKLILVAAGSAALTAFAMRAGVWNSQRTSEPLPSSVPETQVELTAPLEDSRRVRDEGTSSEKPPGESTGHEQTGPVSLRLGPQKGISERGSTPISVRDGERELALLGEARRALTNGTPERALSLVGQLDREFPRGLLLEERRVIQIMALCELGKSTEAKRRVMSFRLLYPRSVYISRVVAGCVDAPPK